MNRLLREYQVPMEAQLPLTGNGHITYKIERNDEGVGERLLQALQKYDDPHFLHKTETTWDFSVLDPIEKSFTFLTIDANGVTVVIPGDFGALYPVARLPPLQPNDDTIASLLEKTQTKYYKLSYGVMQSACARLNAEYKIKGEELFARPGTTITTVTMSDFGTTQTCEDPIDFVDDIGDDEVTVECNKKIVASYPSNIPTTTAYCIALQETMGYNPWKAFSSQPEEVVSKYTSPSFQKKSTKSNRKKKKKGKKGKIEVNMAAAV